MLNKIILSVLFGVLSLGIVSFSDVYAVNQNLYVSAENPFFQNYMSGPQVIEVVIIDPAASDTDLPQPEPDVTVNGQSLRMLQANDGNWYGYFADRNMAQIADSTAILENGVGLDYGDFCGANDGIAVLGIDMTETDGFAVSNTGEITGIIGTDPGSHILDNCTFTSGISDNTMNVLRETKTPNGDVGVGIGQIGLNSIDNWPFIQLYELNPTGIVQIDYNTAGGVQRTILTFDTVDHLASLELDYPTKPIIPQHTTFPQNSQVHVAITDLWLNIDPTDEDSWTFQTNELNSATLYQMFDENGVAQGDAVVGGAINIQPVMEQLMCDHNCVLLFYPDHHSPGIDSVTIQDNDDAQITLSGDSESASSAQTAQVPSGTYPITIVEDGSNRGIFVTYDEDDVSTLRVTDNAPRGSGAVLDYNESGYTIPIGFGFGSIDIQLFDDEWNSGEEIPVELVDVDLNLNTRVDEDLDVYNPNVPLIPSLTLGNPFTLSSLSNDVQLSGISLNVDDVQRFSQRAMLTTPTDITLQSGDTLVLTLDDTFADLYTSINDPTGPFTGFNYFNYDIRSFDNDFPISITKFNVDISDGTTTTRLGTDIYDLQGFFDITNADIFSMNDVPVQIILTFDMTTPLVIPNDTTLPIVIDFFSFGILNDGISTTERINNVIIRSELEETGDDTSTFEGSLAFFMVNQLDILDSRTYEDNLKPIADDPKFPVFYGLTDEHAPRIIYDDLGADGVVTQISDQEEARSHSGIISLNLDSYKAGDDVDVTLEDLDLNTHSDIIDIYTVVDPTAFPSDPARDTVGKEGLGLYTTTVAGEFGRLVDVKFDEHRWTSGLLENGGACGSSGVPDDGLHSTGFTFVETTADSGIFTADFTIPFTYCNSDVGLIQTTTGTDIEVNYVDFTDAGNSVIEVGDSASVRAFTGSVSLDRPIYPVPFGSVDDFFPGLSESDNVIPDGDSIFPVHETGVIADGDQNIDVQTEEIIPGDLLIHVRVDDPDFDLTEYGIDEIALGQNGPVKILLTRGSETLLLATAGGISTNNGVITNGETVVPGITRELGPIIELAPDAGVFEFDLPIRYTDGPDSLGCPVTPDDGYHSLNGDVGAAGRFDQSPQNGSYCILSGDVITAEYADPTDASGNPNIVTDTAYTDLRDGVILTDKTQYIIGGDMIFTLVDPDLDLDNDRAETYDLDLIEWDSDAATLTIGDLGGEILAFEPEPLHLRETGDSTGIFQVVLEIPSILQGNVVEEGTQITLEYTDWGITGAPYVGVQSKNSQANIHTADFMVTTSTDASLYVIDETVTFSGFVGPVFTFQPVDVIIKNPSGNIAAFSETYPQVDGSYSIQFVIEGSSWAELGTYTATVAYYTAHTTTSFEVETNALFCNDMNISELISSGLYNVINNNDGHLDGARIDGTNGDDLILASDAGNEIRSKKGNDCVIGGSGNDEIRGGSGNDQLFGNAGNDLILGGNHDDVLYGGEGDDQLRGGKGIDSIFGETGNDNLKGNNDNDALSCGDGIDIANGGRGTDTATADCETIKKVP